MNLFCAVCLEIEAQTPGDAATIIHGYAVCAQHFSLMQAGSIWPDEVFKARGGPKEKTPAPPKEKRGSFVKSASGASIVDAMVPVKVDPT